jgi:hypothetical protein
MNVHQKEPNSHEYEQLGSVGVVDGRGEFAGREGVEGAETGPGE